MALELKDRIYTECVGTGTGAVEITVPKDGYQGWDSLDNGAHTYYCIIDDTSWEVGHGRYTNSGGLKEITRSLLTSSTGSLLNLSGTASIFCTYPAEKSVYLDLDNNIELPNSDAVLKYIAGIQVTAPAVVTEAVIVDGVAGADGDLAGLLNVYRKDEIDDQQEVQDDQIEKNKQNIIELEEEIEAIAPSFDRGEWDYKAPVVATDLPAEGNYFILDDSGNSITSFANAHEVLFNDKDVYDALHTWGTVEVGQYLELFDSLDGEYLLAKIEVITPESNSIRFEVTPQQSDGVAGGGSDRVRIKIFEISGVDASTLMPKAGGTFTGDVKHKKDIVIEPTLPNRFVNIKNRYATDANGDSAGSESQNFGVNFDLDHGNSGYNTVKWTNRNGNIFAVYGGTQPNAKYTGVMADRTHLVNKGYVDTYSLSSGLERYRKKGGVVLGDNQFGVDSSNVGTTYVLYFNKLFLNDNENVKPVKNYEATDDTWFEVYKGSDLILKMQIKRDSWETSAYSANQIQCTGVYTYPLISVSENWSTSTDYKILLTGLRKKQTSLGTKIASLETKMADKQSIKTRN